MSVHFCSSLVRVVRDDYSEKMQRVWGPLNQRERLGSTHHSQCLGRSVNQGALTRNRVNPDIIIHQPGHDDENILVIEVKKSTNSILDDADLLKLEQIKRQIGYRYALFVRLFAGPDAELAKVRTVWL
jgi:hypothetical protein